MDDTRLIKSKISEPYYQVTTAKELLLFTLRICDMLEKGEIVENELNKTIIVNNILRIDCNWKSHTFTDFATNLKLCVMGNCFIVIDEALNGIFGDRPQNYSDTDIDALRAIIYMLRCAVAHNPTAPVWNAKGVYCRDFRIAEIRYELRVKQLNNIPVNHSHYGGLKGVISLIDYSLKTVKEYGSKPAKID